MLPRLLSDTTRPLLLSLLLVLGIAVPVQAQETGLAFLRLGVNASAMAVGDAQTALTRDAFSVYWNPAGLAAASSNSVALSHHIWIADTRTYTAAARFRAGERGGVGLFVTATDSELEQRSQPTPEPDGTFSVSGLNASAAYGRTLGPVRAGVAVKYLTERIFGYSSNGYAIDAGLQYDLGQDFASLGVALQNLGSMSDLAEEATELPTLLRGGVAVSPLSVQARSDGATVLDATFIAEVSHVFTDAYTRVHLGTAIDVLDLVTVRAGYITNDDLRSLTFGGGLMLEGIQFDYAFLPFEEGFEGPGHVLSLLYTW